MKNKRFPTILGIFFLTAILVVGVYLSQRNTSLSSKASTTCDPINAQITNLTYPSFDFSFTTASSCVTTLIINNKIYQDSSSSSKTHYFKVANLSASTLYQFNLISNAVTYTRPEYSLTTALKPNSPIPTSNLAWGRILNSDGTPVSGAIVYLIIPGSQALSAFSNKDGNWNISFATSFNENKTDWFNPGFAVDEDIIVYSPDGKLTQVVNSSDNNDPVPDIVIDQNSFSILPTPTIVPFLGSGTASSASINLTVTSPKESETINTLKPDIFGQGLANTTFQLSLDDNSTNVTVPSNNTWHWSPSVNLSIGPHKLVLTYQGKTVTRNFTVAMNNNYLAFTSTPSATLIPTQIISPTLAPTTAPTNVPTMRTAKPSTTSALLESGTTMPTYFLIILSSLLFSVSLYYYRR
jgi:hypothetical protein